MKENLGGKAGENSFSFFFFEVEFPVLSFLLPSPCRGEWGAPHTNQMWGGEVRKLLKAWPVSPDQCLILVAVNWLQPQESGGPGKSGCLLWWWKRRQWPALLELAERDVRVFPMDHIRQGSPTPGPQTRASLWPVRNRATQQEVSSRRVMLHLYLQPLPITPIPTWAPPPVRSTEALDSHRNVNLTLNCTSEESRLRSPYENPMPDDLKWSWGSDTSTGEWLQIQIIISREVWLHRDYNKSIACRLISKPCQWVASENKLRAPTDSALWWVV